MENNTKYYGDIERWNSYFRRKLIPTGVVLTIYLLTGTLGNILILYIHLKQMPKNDNRYIITVLSFVNLVACCVTTTFFFTLTFFNMNYPSDIMCKTFFFLTVFFVVESAGLIVIITVQRYLKLCKPYSRQMTDRHKRLAILISIVTSLAMSFPCFYSSGQGPIGSHLNVSGTYCWIRGEHYEEVGIAQTCALAVLLGSFFICSCLLYRKIGQVLIQLSIRRRIREGDGETTERDKNVCDTDVSFIQSEQNTDFVERRRRKPIHVNFYRMFLTMFCVYVISSIPTITILMISHFDHSIWFNVEGGGIDVNVIHTLQDMFLLKFSADPVIYGYFDIAFRQKVVEIFKCKR